MRLLTYFPDRARNFSESRRQVIEAFGCITCLYFLECTGYVTDRAGEVAGFINDAIEIDTDAFKNVRYLVMEKVASSGSELLCQFFSRVTGDGLKSATNFLRQLRMQSVADGFANALGALPESVTETPRSLIGGFLIDAGDDINEIFRPRRTLFTTSSRRGLADVFR